MLRQTIAVLVDRLPPFVTLLLRLRGNTEIERDALERRRAFDHKVAELIAAAREDGSLRQDIDPRTVTRLLFGTINSIVEWYKPGARCPPRRSSPTTSSPWPSTASTRPPDPLSHPSGFQPTVSHIPPRGFPPTLSHIPPGGFPPTVSHIPRTPSFRPIVQEPDPPADTPLLTIGPPRTTKRPPTYRGKAFRRR